MKFSKIKILSILGTWPGWILMILFLRLGISIFNMQANDPYPWITQFVDQVATTKDSEVCKLSLNILNQIAQSSENKREHILSKIKDKSFQNPHIQEIFSPLQIKIQFTSEQILFKALQNLQPHLFLKIRKIIWFVFIISNGVFIIIPIFIFLRFGKNKIAFFYGQYSFIKMILLIFIFGISITIKYFSFFLSQITLNFLSILLIYLLLHSPVIQIILKFSHQRILQFIVGYALIIFSLLVLYFPNQANIVTEKEIETALTTLEQEYQHTAMPALLGILKNSQQFSWPIIEKNLAIISKYADESYLPILLTILENNPSDLRLQKEILQTTQKILCRSK